MSKFYINGEIVSKEFEKCNLEDVCPKDIQDFISSLADGEDIELQFSSLGGDVLAGLQICALLADAQRNGHKTIANVTSIAASMASVIACACQELNLYEGAFMMCHLPWTMAMGNSKDLQKEIATLEQIKNSMVKIYKTKFDLTDEEIDEMLEAETWIDVDNYKDWKLNCKIVANGEPLKIAASISNKHFKNIPTRILSMTKNEEKDIVKAEEKPVEEEVVDVSAKAETKEETSTEETTTEDPSEPEEEKETPDKEKEKKPTYEELETRISELVKENEDLKKQLAECGGDEKKKDLVTREECEKRVHGMQAKLQSQINDFQNQIELKVKEIESLKNEASVLNQKLDKSDSELKSVKADLDKTASALEEKENALACLNANVNSRPQEEELLTLKEVQAKFKGNPEKIVEILKSGKFVR